MENSVRPEHRELPAPSGGVRLLVAANWLVLVLLFASAAWTAWIVVQNWSGISV